MPYTSEAREIAYEHLRYLLRHRMITREKFISERAKIDRREAKSVALAEAKRAKREAEVLARREAKKAETAKRNADKKEAKKHERLVRVIPGGLLREKYKTAGTVESAIRDMWRNTVGSRARFIGGQVDVTIDVAGKDKGYKSFRQVFLYDTNGSAKFKIGDTFLISLHRLQLKSLSNAFVMVLLTVYLFL
jgi:hypothetical protein